MAEQKSSLYIVGHRGACGYEPENTLRSFKRALDDGVSMIELDVQLCASGELVVMHDLTVDRTTNGHGKVALLPYTKLLTFDAGMGEHIPLLTEVIDMIHGRAIINIELKGPLTAHPVAELLKKYVTEKGYKYSDFIVTSFDHYAVREFAELCPDVKRGVILEAHPIGHAECAERAHAHYIIVYYETVNAEFVADAHARNIQVFAYTVNSVEIANELTKIGVDGIFTNYPNLFLSNRTNA